MNALDDPTVLATLQATIDHFGQEHAAEVIERLGATVAEHRAASSAFAEEVAKPRAKRDPELARRYAKAFSDAAARLASTKPSMESLGPRRAHPEIVARAEVGREAPSREMSKAAPPAKAPPGLRAPLDEGVPSARSVRSDRPAAPPVVMTAELPLLARATSPRALPFRDADPDAFLGRLREARTPRSALPPSTGTEELGVGAELPPSTPFQPRVAVPGGLPITLLQYAEILAETGLDPAREGWIWRRYGIHEEAERRAVESAFRAEFDRRPEVRDQLGVLVRRHRARLGRP